MNYSFNAFRILSSEHEHKQNTSSPSNISLMLCVIFARITHVKVCSVKYSCPLGFSYKMRKEGQGRNPVKFGCVVGGVKLMRRRRRGSREEKDFDKVEMEPGTKKTKIKKKGGRKKKEPLASPSFPRCI